MTCADSVVPEKKNQTLNYPLIELGMRFNRRGAEVTEGRRVENEKYLWLRVKFTYASHILNNSNIRYDQLRVPPRPLRLCGEKF
jgi:hypothetical protein